MDKILKLYQRKVLVFLLLLSSIDLSAQYEWAPYGAEWHYCIPELSTSNPFYSYERYVASRDTIIDGKVCRVVESSLNKEYFYQDASKVYYWFNNRFNLIYNFEVEIGDTIDFDFKSISEYSLDFDTSFQVSCIVESIKYNVDTSVNFQDSIKSINTKIIQREDLDFIIWPLYYSYTEKYGYFYEFLFKLKGPSLDYPYRLRCYSDFETILESNWWAQYDIPCDYTLGINVLQESKIVNIFPNPCTDLLYIEKTAKVELDYINILVINQNGAILEQFELCEKMNHFDISHYDSGVYYLKISHRKNTKEQIFKILKL